MKPLRGRDESRAARWFRFLTRGIAFATVLRIPQAVAGTNAKLPTKPNAAVLSSAGVDGYLTLIFALFVLHALFAAAETALRSVSRSRMSMLADDGDRRAAAVMRLIERPASFLTAIQVLKTVLSLSIAVTTYAAASRFFDESATALSVIATVCGILFLSLLFGEIIPKVIASQHADVVALFSASWIRLITAVIYPMFRAIDRLSLLFVSRESARTSRSPVEAEEEIKMMAAGGVETGEIEPEEQEMIRGVLTATDKVAREVMVPRIDLTAVDIESPIDEALDAILREGHSRIPIYEESIDHIIGIIHARDLLQAMREREVGDLKLRDLALREPHFIPENKRLLDLLREFRQSKTPIAIVVDEYGGTAGLVTIEDLLEEIVGEIMDESDIEAEPFQRLDERTVVFDARVPIEDVNEMMASHLPEDEFDTIGGFIFGQVGRLPASGQEIAYDGLTLTVESADGHRIQSVRIRRDELTESEDADPKRSRNA